MSADHDHDDEPAGRSAPGDPDDDAIRALVKRLSRKHPSGGRVVERAALQASGTGLQAVLRWIEEHGGVPEAAAPVPVRSMGGLHGGRDAGRASPDKVPLRFVLPAGTLD